MNFVDSATLLDWGYNNFSVQTVFTKDDLIQEIPVLLSKETNAVLVHTAEDVNILLPNDVTTDMLERKVTVYGDTAFAPIEAGQELGEMTLSYDGYDYATVKLLAADSVSVNRFLQGKYLLSHFFSKPLVKILTVVVILLVLAVVGGTFKENVDGLYWIWLMVKVVLISLFIIVTFPALARWFFRRPQLSRQTQITGPQGRRRSVCLFSVRERISHAPQ